MSDNIAHVEDDTFATEVLNSDQPVLVDFWAEWCGPCKMIAPVVDQIADEYDGKLSVVKMDVSDNQKIPMQYGVRNIPTLMIFKGGEVHSTKVGMITKGALKQFVEAAI